ncbi:dTDP-4-dehydrorhamnose reductase [hydrothermal vent metagenome]|uniref:dTDP-4-dehydrorhamnose reductase n=1 Tax=hydrothermal vent metagenome TaxID=652676 RepID=A0A1W1BK94_9ZZZZ
MSNILVTGSHGQLGSEIKTIVKNNSLEYADKSFFFTTKDSLDITDKSSIEAYIKNNNIDIIINCAAYTAVDNAEENIIMADAINREAVKDLAVFSKKYNIELIHISTDYLFDGNTFKPYTEDIQSNPQGIYSKTKLAGEQEIRQVNPSNSIIIRTSWIYSSLGTNFVKTMLRLGEEKESLNVVFDQIGTPTYARDLASAILSIINHPIIHSDDVSIYHYSNEGVASWYDFAKSIFEISNINCKVNPIETHQYPTPAKRPYYSILNKAKIKKDYGLDIPYWRDSLKDCLLKTSNKASV